MFSMHQFAGETIEVPKEKKETTAAEKVVSRRWHCPKCGCSRYDSTSFCESSRSF